MKLEGSYYNDSLGDTSFLLAGLLEVFLKVRNDWDLSKWLDDSLLTDVNLNGRKLSILGIMIWGIENSTEQWTDPFCFEIELGDGESYFSEYTFSLGDLNKPEMTYEEFSMNRNYWDQNERDWKYIINQKSEVM